MDYLDYFCYQINNNMKRIILYVILGLIVYKFVSNEIKDYIHEERVKAQTIIADYNKSNNIKYVPKKHYTKKEIFENVLILQQYDLVELNKKLDQAESKTAQIWYQCKIDILNNKIKATKEVITEL